MIHLQPIDEARLERLLSNPDGVLPEIISNGPAVKDFLLPVLQQALDFHRRIGSRAPWHGYLGVESESNRLVGICGFKGAPDAAGVVEIAYASVPGFEGRGVATEMARALIAIAFQSPAVRCVIAHTLPEPNASTRVLEKTGMRKTGEVIDPEDGKVWRWEMNRPD